MKTKDRFRVVKRKGKYYPFDTWANQILFGCSYGFSNREVAWKICKKRARQTWYKDLSPLQEKA